MPTETEIFKAVIVASLTFEPLSTALEDSWNHTQGLDVVNQRRLPPQSVSTRERRLVAWLCTFAFQCFKQSGLLSTNISPGTDKDFDVTREIGAENTFSGEAPHTSLIECFLQPMFLIG